MQIRREEKESSGDAWQQGVPTREHQGSLQRDSLCMLIEPTLVDPNSTLFISMDEAEIGPKIVFKGNHDNLYVSMTPGIRYIDNLSSV